MKRNTTTKRARGSSSSSFDNKQFVSAHAEAHFHDLVKKRSSLKEKGFEIDSHYLSAFETIIKHRGWQDSICYLRRRQLQ